MLETCFVLLVIISNNRQGTTAHVVLIRYSIECYSYNYSVYCVVNVSLFFSNYFLIRFILVNLIGRRNLVRGIR
jgi:predicted membrane protein